MRLEDVTVNDPGPSEVRVRHNAIAVNYHDIYVRSGLYPVDHLLPLVLGTEAAGVVMSVGRDVTNVKQGDRVAYACRPYGAFSEERLISVRHLVVLPEAIDTRIAAAIMVKGMTAEYLLHRTHRVQAGDTILVHAAAGGVGLILCQWARHIGARVIGTVGSSEKATLARNAGCDYPIEYRKEDFVKRVSQITGGKGVRVVYDSVGRDTFSGSLECLTVHGHLISFGQSSGSIENFKVAQLGTKSLSLTRPVLFDYIEERSNLEEISQHLFQLVAQGSIKVSVNQSYSLANAAQAQSDLESRRTTGSSLLIP